MDMVGGTSLVDWPTMGSLWTRRWVRFLIQNFVKNNLYRIECFVLVLIVLFHLQLQWSGLQDRSAHQSFILSFDHLSSNEVIWEPYED